MYGCCGLVEDLRDGSGFDDHAVLHDHDAVGEVGHHAHVVRDEDDRRVEALVQVAQQIEDLCLNGHVERGGRLVGDQQQRIARDRLRDHGALALAAGELVRVLVERLLGVGHLHEAEEFDRLLLRDRGRHPAVVRAERLHDLEADRVDRVERGHRLLEDRGDLVAAQRAQGGIIHAPQFAPEQLDRAGDACVLRKKPEQRHRARALARAGLADDREDLAAPDVRSSCRSQPGRTHPRPRTRRRGCPPRGSSPAGRDATPRSRPRCPWCQSFGVSHLQSLRSWRSRRFCTGRHSAARSLS